jgi:hypothetical protein
VSRKGVRSVVLESSATLRTSGFAFMTWTNAFRALDALGVGDKMRSQHVQVQGYSLASSIYSISMCFCVPRSCLGLRRTVYVLLDIQGACHVLDDRPSSARNVLAQTRLYFRRVLATRRPATNTVTHRVLSGETRIRTYQTSW